MVDSQAPYPAPAWFVREAAGRDSVGTIQPMRLLVLHWDHFPTSRVVYQQCLPGRGHRVVWLERRSGLDPSGPEAPHENCTVLPVPEVGAVRLSGFLGKLEHAFKRRVRDAKNRLEVLRMARAESFDLIQARDLISLALLAWFAARLTRTRFAYQIDFPHPEGHLGRTDGMGGWSMGRQRMVWTSQIRIRDWLLRRADLVYAISDDMRDRFVARGVQPERVHVFPVGVGPSFLEDRDSRKGLRERLGVGDHPVVAYAGSLGGERGLDFFCEILKGIGERVRDARFIVLNKNIGENDERVRALGLADRLVHLGRVPHAQVSQFLVAADIGLFPIDVTVPRGVYQVSSPLKVAEYMAAGLAVVSSPLPEATQLVTDAACGSVVADNSADGFVSAVELLCQDLEGTRAKGERARQYIYAYKSFDRLTDVVEAAMWRHAGRT